MTHACFIGPTLRVSGDGRATKLSIHQ